MAQKLVLYFTAGPHRLYRARRGGLEHVASFSADEQGVAAFRDFLRAARGALVAVLADVAGEEFHEDQIPFLRGADRTAVVQRRLAQRFRDARLAAALSLGPAAAERRAERLLLASFANTAQFAPWLDALAEAGVRLAGVYSAPLLAPVLAARLGARAGPVILVTVNSVGLRQCYMDNGRLRFARLEPAADLAPDALAAFARSETLRLAQYLATLRALPREGPPVQVLVVAPDGRREAFERALVSDARATFHTLEMAEAAHRIGLRRLVPGDRAEQLFLQLALRRPPREQFARVEDRRAYYLWQARRALAAAGAAAFGACAIYAGTIWLDILGVREQAAAQRREALEATRKYERITATFPVTLTTTDNLKAVVVQFQAIAARTASPEGALAHLSRVMEQFPQIELDALAWSTEPPRELQAAKAAPPAPATAPRPAEADARPPQAALAQFLQISGRIETAQHSDYRAITREVQRFAQALAAAEGWRVASTKLPFDVTPDATLTGDIGADTGRGEAPRFSIVIARSVP